MLSLSCLTKLLLNMREKVENSLHSFKLYLVSSRKLWQTIRQGKRRKEVKMM